MQPDDNTATGGPLAGEAFSDSTAAPPQHFADALLAAIAQKKSSLVLGLDPQLQNIPLALRRQYAPLKKTTPHRYLAAVYQAFCRFAIAQMHPYVVAVKPNIAFFEVAGAAGLAALRSLIDYAHQEKLLVLLDAKRGDIPSTATAYANAYLNPYRLNGLSLPPYLPADALTLAPYFGVDSLAPFLKASTEGKGVFVCVKTSNPGAADFQELLLSDGRPLYSAVADRLAEEAGKMIGEKGYSALGVVVGATDPHAAAALRKQLPYCFFLVPGLLTQGGKLEAMHRYLNADGKGALFNFSRSLLYPKPPQAPLEEQAAAMRLKAQELHRTLSR